MDNFLLSLSGYYNETSTNTLCREIFHSLRTIHILIGLNDLMIGNFLSQTAEGLLVRWLVCRFVTGFKEE